MAASRLSTDAVAFMFGDGRLALNPTEAYAVSNLQAGTITAQDRAILRAWLVKMTLLHGTWVEEECAFLQT
jgi:hypothetical protein